MSSEIQNLHLLEKDLKENKQIVLFVGAGINCSKGVHLLWNQLIDNLFSNVLVRISMEKGLNNSETQMMQRAFGLEDILNEESIGKSVYPEILDDITLQNIALQEFPLVVKASVIKSVLGESYLSFIQDYIYGQCSRNMIKDAFESCYSNDRQIDTADSEKLMHSLYQTARMIILCQDIKAVVTYNYDNFLTCAIKILLENKDKYFTNKELEIVESRKLNVKDISGLRYEYALKDDTLFIYHVHGYIPPPSEADELRDRSIVMSLEEYHEYSMNDMAAWQTSTQIHFLSHYTCVCLGLSLSDITTQRLLHYVSNSGNQERLYQLFAYNPIGSSNKTCSKVHKSIVEMKMDFHIIYGLTPIVCLGSYEELYARVADMMSEIAISNK